MSEVQAYNQYPHTERRDDFWRQVRRTLNGQSISQEQIDMIIKTVNKNLLLSGRDVLLDLGCGNGALSRYFFNDICGFYGVDYSEYLVSIAKEYFERLPRFVFQQSDILAYLKEEVVPERFTKCLFYGTSQYLTDHDLSLIFSLLYGRFPNIGKVFIGSVPDQDKSALFYKDKVDDLVLKSNNTPIGIWRTRSSFSNLVKKTGWNIEIDTMPKEFYSSYYRFDAILVRGK